MSRVTTEPWFTAPSLPNAAVLNNLVRLLARDAARADFFSQQDDAGREGDDV